MTVSSGRRDVPWQQIERTGQIADGAECDAGIVVGRFDPRMAEQHLNDPDVGLVLQQMAGEGMAQRMGRDALLDPGNLRRAPNGPADDVGGERIACDHAGEQPVFGMGKAVPFTQHRQQIGRQHDVAVLVALALLDADHHAGTIDVGDLEVDQFGDAQSGGVTGAQYDLIFEAGSGGEQTHDLVLAQDHRQLLGLLDVGDGGDQIVARCGDAVEESECRQGLVDHMHGIAAVDQMEAEQPEVVGTRLVGRAAQKLGEDLDAVDIGPVGLGREVAERHVVDQALAQRADGGGLGHVGLLSRVRVWKSPFSRQDVQHFQGHLPRRPLQIVALQVFLLLSVSTAAWVAFPPAATAAESSGAFSMNVHEKFNLTTPGGAVAVAWSSDGSLAAASNYGGVITVWDPSGHLISQFKRNGGGPALGRAIAFVNSSSQLLFLPPEGAANNTALDVWDVATGQIVNSVDGPEPGKDYPLNRAQHFMTTPDQSILAAGTFGNRGIQGIRANIVTYDTKDWHILRTAMIDYGIFSLSIFGDGRLLVIGSGLGRVAVLDALSGERPHEFHAYDESEFGDINVGAVAGSPDGNFLLAGVGQVSISGMYSRAPDKVKAWAESRAWADSIEPVRIVRTNGEKVVAFTAAKTPIRQAVWDPKGRYVSFVDSAGGLFVWQPMVPGMAYKRISLASSTFALAVSPDGGRIAVTTDHGVKVFTVE